MVIDLTCSATADAWTVLSEVVHNYKDTVKFNIRILPLPYHQFSFLVSKAASAVYFYHGNEEAFLFMNSAILNQPLIYNSVTNDKTYNDIKSIVKGWATNSTSMTSREFEEGFDINTSNGNTIEMFTRYEFKTVVLSGYYATPTYSINGLHMDGLDTYDEWKEALEPLIAKNTKQIESDPSIIYL